MTEFEYVTTNEHVYIYKSAARVFGALLREIRELSKKKPDATLNKSKVSVINNLLVDLMIILEDEPEGKYLQKLSDEELPQVSDALMMMAQFDAALAAFQHRYHRKLGSGYSSSDYFWITVEFLEQLEATKAESPEDDSEEKNIPF